MPWQRRSNKSDELEPLNGPLRMVGAGVTATILKYAERGFLCRILFLSALHQLSIAFVTALLTIAAKNISNTLNLVYILGAFAVVAQVPNLIEIVLRKTERPGYYDMFKAYLNDRLISQTGRTDAWASRDQRERFLTAVGPEAEAKLMSLASTWLDAYSFLLNIVFTTIVLTTFVDGDFSWVFLVSLVLSFLTYRFFQPKLNALVKTDQQSQMRFLAYIAKAWDNILLNNRNIHQHYQETLDRDFSAARANAVRETSWTMLSVFTISLVASLPIFGLNIYLAWAHPARLDLVAALAVTLPRQLSVITSFRNLFAQLTNIRNFGIRFESARQNSSLEYLDLSRKIDFGRLLFNERTLSDLDELRAELNSQSNRRITISGPNGAGKSTLLLLLNQELPNSVYIPAAPALEIKPDYAADSTGQRMLKHVEYAIGADVPFLLLDEWDANLDQVNCTQISALLDQTSRTKTVIEVRHKRES